MNQITFKPQAIKEISVLFADWRLEILVLTPLLNRIQFSPTISVHISETKKKEINILSLSCRHQSCLCLVSDVKVPVKPWSSPCSAELALKFVQVAHSFMQLSFGQLLGMVAFSVFVAASLVAVQNLVREVPRFSILKKKALKLQLKTQFHQFCLKREGKNINGVTVNEE